MGFGSLLAILPPLVIAITLFSPSRCVTAAARDILPRGASIAVEDHASHALRSPDGTFACGFYNVSSTVFTFSVWFARSADRTVVWSANRGRPVHSKGSRLALDSRGALLLTDYNGEVVWNSTAADPSNATRARLHDSGNLAVEDQRGNILWQSFDSPTDTLLPTQRITAGKDLVSADRFLSPGYYTLRFSDYAMLSLAYDNRKVESIYWPNPYFSYWQNSRKIYNFSRTGELDTSGHFLASDNATFDASDLGDGVKRRLTLDTDGNLRLYGLDETVGTWAVSWMAFGNPCNIHGVCGANAVCLYVPAPTCVCAPGHERLDPNDWSSGCRPMFNSTGNAGRKRPMKLLELPHTDFWGFDLNNSEFLSLDGCAEQCRNDPSCVVFQYKQGKGECYPKSLMFNGRSFPGLPGAAYIMIPDDFDVPELTVHQWQRNGGLPIQLNIVGCGGGGASSSEFFLNVSDSFSRSSNKRKSIWFYFYGFLSAFFIIEVFVISFGCWLFSKKGAFRPLEVSALEEGYRMITSHFRGYSYSELERATKKFRNEIGRGGSGVVYKGVLDDERVVAVKVLQDVCQSEEVFQAELSVIGRIYHMNLVRMWGFCSEGTHRILVYEYIENGSLAKVLFQSENSITLLGWKQRFNIALGVAKGLAYLHDECLEWIIHCDMKPENILLDGDMEPKITDFGLSKLLNRDGSGSDMSRIRGTRGYMAPEWVSSLPITEKVDVYSYGVMLLELMKGRRISDWVVDGKEGLETDVRSVVKMIVDKLESTTEAWILDLIDERLNGDINQVQATMIIQLAISCLEEDRNKRPSMKSVVQMLISADEAQVHKNSPI